jgi:lysophospholipase L1-like esterase
MTNVNKTVVSKKRLKKIAILVGFAFAFILAEVALRINYQLKNRRLSENMTYVDNVSFSQTWTKPNLNLPFWNTTKYHIRTNNLGYRMREDIELKKDPSKYRIVCVGGSTTFGTGLDNKDTFEYILEDKLKKVKENIQIVNAGFLGHSSPHLVNDFQLRVRPLEPDMLLIYCGNNDLAQFYAPNYDPLYSKTDLTIATPPAIAKYSAVAMFFWQRYDTYTRSLRAEVSSPARDTARPVIEGFKRNLETIIIVSKAKKCKVVLCTFTCSPKRSLSYYDLTNNVLRELSKKYDCQLIDMARLFPQKLEHFQAHDLMHFSPQGERVRTDILYEHLVKLLVK